MLILRILCIGPNDVTAFTQVRLVRVIPLVSVSLTFRLDGISQENNETFSLEYDIDLDDRDFFPERSVFSDVTIKQFDGIIIDQDSELRC
jgi:hypothetical protein